MHNIKHLKKSNLWILDRLGDCDIISEAIGGGGGGGGGGRGRKNLFLQRTLHKAEISFLQVRLIWKRQTSKIHNSHFSTIKA